MVRAGLVCQALLVLQKVLAGLGILGYRGTQALRRLQTCLEVLALHGLRVDLKDLIIQWIQVLRLLLVVR